MSNNQTILRPGTRGHISIYDLMVRDNEHRPTWERPSGPAIGSAELEVHVSDKGRWTQINVAEYGIKSSKKASICLAEAAGIAVAKYLADKYGIAPAKEPEAVTVAEFLQDVKDYLLGLSDEERPNTLPVAPARALAVIEWLMTGAKR